MTRQLFQRQSNFKNCDDPSLFTEKMSVKHGPQKFFLHLCRLMLISVGPAQITVPADQKINNRKGLSWSQRLLHLLEVNITEKDRLHYLSVLNFRYTI